MEWPLEVPIEAVTLYSKDVRVNNQVVVSIHKQMSGECKNCTVAESELSTSHSGILCIPKVVTYSTVGVVDAYLYIAFQ